ncbi:MAG: glycoside hydrolase family 16 protein [Tetrasphaera sp.]
MTARSPRPVLIGLAVLTLAGAAGIPSASTAPGSAQVFHWAGPGFRGFTTKSRAGGAVTSGVVDPAAIDGKAATLRFGSRRPGPAWGSELQSPQKYLFGVFTNRLRTPNCADQPNAGIVTGNFTYGNDGSELDGDGLTDNSELDIEVLCARPEIVTVSIWTDYRESDSAQRRVTRMVNLRTGRILETRYYTNWDTSVPLTGPENMPKSIAGVGGFDSSAAYYDYVIRWAADRVVFQVVAGGRTITLWDYRGPRSRIPQTKAAFLTNVWHTSTWAPPGHPGALLPPTHPVTAWIDRTRIAATIAP